MSGTKQSRNFDIVTYLDRDTLIYKLSSHWEAINWYAFIEHALDSIDPSHPDLGLKQTHTHVVLVTRSPNSLKTIRNWLFDSENHQNSLVAFAVNLVGATRYLIHMDDPVKYQYAFEDIYTTHQDLRTFMYSCDSGADPYREMVDCVLDGWSDTDLTDRYGQLFIRNQKIIHSTAKILKDERVTRARYENYIMEVLENEYWQNCECDSTEGRL